MKTTNTSRIGHWLPKTAGRRWLLGLGLGVVGLLCVVGWVVFSVWVEDRHPCDDAKHALLPQAQRFVTKPVVNTLSRQLERYERSRAERMYMSTGLTLEETIARFLDDRVDLAERRIYAYRLARVGSPKAIAALLKVFQTAPPEHKAFMAQLIGSTGNPAATAWLMPLLADADNRVVIAAIRGLSAIGGPDVAARIANILTDPQRSDVVCVEAALGLGAIGTPTARTALVEAFGLVPSTEVATQILNCLGQFPFSTVAEGFQAYLAAPETPTAMRVVAAESLAYSTAEAVPFLLGLAESDGNADVREAAAWAISAHSEDANLGPALAGLVEWETDADVRRRLYEAQLPQSNIPAERLLPMIQSEEDISARVAGFNAIGRAAGQQPAATWAAVFDKEIVPELVQIATVPNSLNIQMRAVFALRRAQTPAAQSALAMIVNSAQPQVATAARNGLPGYQSSTNQ